MNARRRDAADSCVAAAQQQRELAQQVIDTSLRRTTAATSRTNTHRGRGWRESTGLEHHSRRAEGKEFGRGLKKNFHFSFLVFFLGVTRGERFFYRRGKRLLTPMF